MKKIFTYAAMFVLFFHANISLGQTLEKVKSDSVKTDVNPIEKQNSPAVNSIWVNVLMSEIKINGEDEKVTFSPSKLSYSETMSSFRNYMDSTGITNLPGIPLRDIGLTETVTDTDFGIDKIRVDLSLFQLLPKIKSDIRYTPDTTLAQLKDIPLYLSRLNTKLFLMQLAIQQELTKNKKGRDIELEVDGLILDQTISKVGRDFYDYFYAHWEAPLEASNYSITLKEQPPRMNRAYITIFVNEDEVFANFLSPRASVIEAYGDYAIQLVQSHLEERERVSYTLEKGEDMTGTGIF